MKRISLRAAREAHASTPLTDGRVLVVGGLGRDSMEVIDVERGISRMLAAKQPTPLDDLRVVALPGAAVSAWILGGQDTKTGETTDATWVVTLGDETTLERSRGLGVAGGIADPAVAKLGPYVVLAGGEAEAAGQDTELRDARILDRWSGKVYALPPLALPHDDAAAVADGMSVLVFGGYRRQDAAGLELTLPIADNTVERLTLPAHHRERVETLQGW